MWVNKGKEKNALTLVGLELVTPGQEARVLTIRPPVPPYNHHVEFETVLNTIQNC